MLDLKFKLNRLLLYVKGLFMYAFQHRLATVNYRYPFEHLRKLHLTSDLRELLNVKNPIAAHRQKCLNICKQKIALKYDGQGHTDSGTICLEFKLDPNTCRLQDSILVGCAKPACQVYIFQWPPLDIITSRGGVGRS